MLQYYQILIHLSRVQKRVLLLFTDTLLVLFALWFSFSLRLGVWYWPVGEGSVWGVSDEVITLFAVAPLIAIPVFVRFGLYRAIIRYLGMRAVWSVAQAVALYALIWGVLALLSGVPGIPRSVVLINAMVALLAVGGSRMLMRWLLSQRGQGNQAQSEKEKIRVVIFGAGDAGRQLAVGLAHSREYFLSGFVDDADDLHGRELMGVPILSLDQLEPFIEKHRVSDLLLAIPSISRKARNQILERLRPLPVRIRTLPGLADLARGEVNLFDLHELDIDDLLARDPAEPDELLLQSQVKGQVILVTGAGGSIGSEICRQVLRRRPKLLLLFELSEFALYTIHDELLLILNQLVSEGESRGLSLVPKIVPLLGSVQDERRLTELMQTWKPHVIYHAAAFKHVPMVEFNLAEGVKNNVLGTLTVVKCAIQQQLPSVVLISTDKAVRPTNTMGCSKRIAEMILQALMAEKAPIFQSLERSLHNEPPQQVERKTHLSMVRFGNVLGSSGSVVPLFRRQIQQGGPITLTHKKIIRYFMTIPEAAQLVMQAGAMSGEGIIDSDNLVIDPLPDPPPSRESVEAAEVFVLDMGEPVRIFDLAKRMIELSGLRVKDETAPEGDIEIKVTGLRPGEKLYEELLIGNDPQETQHPRIMKAHEEFMPWKELQAELHTLQIATENSDVELIRSLMQKLVKGYQPEEKIVDWVYREQVDRQ